MKVNVYFNINNYRAFHYITLLNKKLGNFEEFSSIEKLHVVKEKLNFVENKLKLIFLVDFFFLFFLLYKMMKIVNYFIPFRLLQFGNFKFINLVLYIFSFQVHGHLVIERYIAVLY